MSAEIDQNVDLLAADELRDRIIGHPGNAVPSIGVLLQPLGDAVGVLGIVKANDFEAIVIVCPEDRRRKIGDRMLMKVGRNISDAQFPVRVARIFVRRDVCQEVIGVTARPFDMLVEQFLRINRAVMQRQQ